MAVNDFGHRIPRPSFETKIRLNGFLSKREEDAVRLIEKPLPLDGGGQARQRRVKVGVKKNDNIPQLARFPLPFIPSRRGRGK